MEKASSLSRGIMAHALINAYSQPIQSTFIGEFLKTTTQIQAFAKKFAKQLTDENVAIFAGAGLSASVGFADWGELLAPFAKEINLNIAKEKDHLVRLAQYSQNHKQGNRHHLNEALITAFPVLKSPSENHEILARLPIKTYWTTNYDKLIETALRNESKIIDVKHEDSQLPNSTARRDAVVYKMHGDVEHPGKAVLTRDDFENYSKNHGGFLNALTGDLTGKTFLFLGFSFADPNLEQVLSQMRQRFVESQREHFAVLRKPKRDDFKNEADFIYAEFGQTHYIKDLARYNVTVLEIDEYHEVTEILTKIEQFYRRKSIFIGGSAEDFSPWNEAIANNFFYNLGGMLVHQGFRIVSGFGLGIGNSLISGAIDRAYSMGNYHLDDFLDVRPFPRNIVDPARRAEIWSAYRKDLLTLPGIAIFLFGNKKVNEKIVTADGVQKEFDIAINQNVLVIPVGGTGSMAKKLGEQVLKNFDSYFKNNDVLIKNDLIALQISHENLDNYLDEILAIIKKLSDH